MMASSANRHHGPLTLFEREYEKAIRAGMPAQRAAIAAMQAAPQHSAPVFDLQTLPPPPMAGLELPIPLPRPRPDLVMPVNRPSALSVSYQPPVGQGRPSILAPNSFPPSAPMPMPRPNFASPQITASDVNPDGSPTSLTSRKVNTVPVGPDGSVTASGSAPNPLSEFYGGAMLAPDRVGGNLVQSQIYPQSSSVADIYKGIYAPSGSPQVATADNPAPAPAAGNTGTLFDASYDPRFPISSAFAGGWGSPASRVAEAAGSSDPGKVQDRLNPGSLLAYGGDQSTDMPIGLAAINNAASQIPLPRPRPPGPVLPGGMDWQPAVASGPAPVAGDPWSTLRVGGSGGAVPRPGMITAARPQMIQAPRRPQGGPGYGGQNTVYNNPTKYGATAADRQAAAAARLALTGG